VTFLNHRKRKERKSVKNATREEQQKKKHYPINKQKEQQEKTLRKPV